MSIRIMSAIFDSKTLGPTERLIMLALADHADDDGRCYPSIERLRQRTGLSERAVQSNLRKLEDQGYLKVIVGGGKGNANLYFVSANPAANAPFKAPNPAAAAPRRKCTPAAAAPQTPQEMHPNPAAAAPEPSGTIIGTVKEEEEEGAHATADVDAPKPAPSLVAQISDALGFNDPKGGGWPKYWASADAGLIAARWITDLGLTDAEVIHVAVANRQAHGSPANGPKTLNRHMQAYAAAKAAPLLEITDQTFGGMTDASQSAHDRRQAAANDRFGRILDAAVRNRAPSRGDFGFG